MARERTMVHKVREVLRLLMEKGLSIRKAARSCGVSRTSVHEYLLRARRADLGYEQVLRMDDATLEAVLYPRDEKRTGNTHKPEPDWKEVREEMKDRDVTLQLLWDEYKSEHPDGYQLSQFYARYRRWKKKLAVHMRQEYKPGEKMFCDYAGRTMPIVINRRTGEVRMAQVFIAVLAASNRAYCEATWDQKTPSLVGSIMRAYEFHKGVTEITITDCLRSGVSRPCRYEPDVNRAVAEMAEHYDSVVIPSRPRSPRDQAKAEACVQIVQRWILAALRKRVFFSLFELNEAIDELLDKLNNRPFKKMDGCRQSVYESIEKTVLKPLPQQRFTLCEWKHGVTVNIDYHIELNRHYYSVPYALVGRKLNVRYTATTVEVFTKKNNRVTSHRRDDTPGRFTTKSEHMPPSHRYHAEWTPSRMIRWAGKTGPAAQEVVRRIFATRKHPEQGYRSCMGIMRLGRVYKPQRLEAACVRAIHINGCSYRTIDSILKNGLDGKPLPSKEKKHRQPILHENVRGSGHYQQELSTQPKGDHPC